MSTTKKLTPAEAGRLGGLAIVRQRGTGYMSEIASRGGNATFERYGSEYMSNLGTLGADVINGHLSKTARLRTERNLRRIINETV